MKTTQYIAIASISLASLAVAGCATTETTDTAQKGTRLAPHELESVTGSNMRRRTPLATSGGDVTVTTRDQLEREGAGTPGNQSPSRSGAP